MMNMHKKSIILYNIPSNATVEDFRRIAAHFGLTWVFGKFVPGKGFTPEGRLYVMTKPITTEQQVGPLSYISFITAAIEFNNAIPVTPWQSGPPPCIGEWIASNSGVVNIRRWWNGEWWSTAYESHESEEYKKESRLIKSAWNTKDIYWRGPSEQPITAGFCK